MGEDNELYTELPVKSDKVEESSLIDLWNRITPINSTRIGATTVVNGKKVTVYDEVEKEIKKDLPSRVHARRQMMKVLYFLNL